MNQKHDHVYAILRVDEFQGPDCPVPDKVTVKEIVWSEEEAEREVARLNGLGTKPEESYYYSQVTRLLPKAAPAPAPAEAPANRIPDYYGQAQKRTVFPPESPPINTLTGVTYLCAGHHAAQITAKLGAPILSAFDNEWITLDVVSSR